MIMIQGTIQYHHLHHHHHNIDITTTKTMTKKYHPNQESNEIRSYRTIQIIKNRLQFLKEKISKLIVAVDPLTVASVVH
jgi:hypothetical protein